MANRSKFLIKVDNISNDETTIILQALIASLLVLIAEIALVRFEHFIISSAKLMNVYIEFETPAVLDSILDLKPPSG